MAAVKKWNKSKFELIRSDAPWKNLWHGIMKEIMPTEAEQADFRAAAEKVKAAVSDDDLFEAMRIALDSLQSAESKESRWLKDSYLGLVRVMCTLLENEYGRENSKE